MFTKYCETIFERYQDKIKYWITINEINAINFISWFGVASESLPQKKRNNLPIICY